MSTKIESAIGKLVNLDLQAKRESERNIIQDGKSIKRIEKDVLEKAIKRAEICKLCKHNELEPLESERYIDLDIPELSNRMCGKCYCPISKKISQNKSKCKLWKD